MNPTNPTTMDCTREILHDLEAVRENLLALSDDIWLSIDHNDPDALEAGVEFKRAFNAKRLSELVLRQVFDEDPERFGTLCGHPDFTSNRGNITFTQDPQRLRKSMQIHDGVFAESNLSANGIRDILRRVLENFGIPTDQLLIFLRQDRDAGRSGDDA